MIIDLPGYPPSGGNKEGASWCGHLDLPQSRERVGVRTDVMEGLEAEVQQRRWVAKQ